MTSFANESSLKSNGEGDIGFTVIFVRPSGDLLATGLQCAESISSLFFFDSLGNKGPLAFLVGRVGDVGEGRLGLLRTIIVAGTSRASGGIGLRFFGFLL